MKPYYEDSAVTIYHGDCLEIIDDLPPVDLVFTSPPYNKGMRIDGQWQGRVTPTCKGSRFSGGYGVCKDDMPAAEYEAWQKAVLTVLYGAVNNEGAVFYNHKPRIVNGRLWTPLALVGDLPLRQIIVWNTGPGVNVMPAAFSPAHEWILLFAKPGFTLENSKIRCAGDVWTITQALKMDEHPAPFPIELPARAIAAATPRRVLDPFCGKGTTLRAAKDAGRRAIGIEVEERYCEMAAKWMEQEVFEFTEGDFCPAPVENQPETLLIPESA